MSAGAGDAEVLERQILKDVKERGSIVSTYEYAKELGQPHQTVVGTVKSLQAEKYLNADSFTLEFLTVTEEAESYIAKGAPELQLFRAIPEEGIDDAGLEATFGKAFVDISKGKAMKNKWISRDKATGKYHKTVASVERDELVDQLNQAKAGTLKDEKVVKDLKTRKLLEVQCVMRSASEALRVFH